MPARKKKLNSSNLLSVPMKGVCPPAGEGDFFPVYENGDKILYEGDSIEWLKTVESATVDLVFADPPYSINKADWEKFESREAYIQWSMSWVGEAARVLKKTGSLYICGFSEILADLKLPSMEYFKGCKWLVWH